MKRDFVGSDQSHSAGDEAKQKLKYQTLLTEYLELQKEFVSRKKKLQAAKQRREVIKAEVRFLKRKRKSFSKSQAPNTDEVVTSLPNVGEESITLQGGRNPSTVDQVLLSNSLLGDDEAGGRNSEEGVRSRKRTKNVLNRDKVGGKRKIRWPDQVTLNL